MWQFTHCPSERSPAIISARMSRLRVVKVYSAAGDLNQRTLHVPVKGLTFNCHTLREMVGETGEMLYMKNVFECVYYSRSSDQPASDCFHNVAILTDDIPKGITDAGIGIGLVMHSKADVHRTIQIGRGFGFPESGAGDFVCHALIIDTGSAGCDHYCATLSTGRAADQFVLLTRFLHSITIRHLLNSTIFQQLGIVFFSFRNQLFHAVVVKVAIQTVINVGIHRFVIHAVNDGLNECILQLVAVNDVFLHVQLLMSVRSTPRFPFSSSTRTVSMSGTSKISPGMFSISSHIGSVRVNNGSMAEMTLIINTCCDTLRTGQLEVEYSSSSTTIDESS